VKTGSIKRSIGWCTRSDASVGVNSSLTTQHHNALDRSDWSAIRSFADRQGRSFATLGLQLLLIPLMHWKRIQKVSHSIPVIGKRVLVAILPEVTLHLVRCYCT
jgi:hypothetical protein